MKIFLTHIYLESLNRALDIALSVSRGTMNIKVLYPRIRHKKYIKIDKRILKELYGEIKFNAIYRDFLNRKQL